MNLTRYRNAWIWLAIAALALGYLARAQAGIEHARACTVPVIEYLAGHQPSRGLAESDGSRLRLESSRAGRLLQQAGLTFWTPVLPVLFIGLLFPMGLSRPYVRPTGHGLPNTPALPCSFQRPPPVLG